MKPCAGEHAVKQQQTIVEGTINNSSREERRMLATSVSRTAVTLFSFAVLIAVSPALGQSGPPEKAKGIAGKPLSTVNLADEIGIPGRALRASLVTVEPGGATPVHDHSGRPEIIYVLKGKLTEHRGGESKEFGPGETFTSGKATTHWIENRGSEPVIFLGTSIVTQP